MNYSLIGWTSLSVVLYCTLSVVLYCTLSVVLYCTFSQKTVSKSRQKKKLLPTDVVHPDFQEQFFWGGDKNVRTKKFHCFANGGLFYVKKKSTENWFKKTLSRSTFRTGLFQAPHPEFLKITLCFALFQNIVCSVASIFKAGIWWWEEGGGGRCWENILE